MPNTRIIKFNAENTELAELTEVVAVLKSGGLVAFPTETVYGLGADAMNAEAVKKVFEVKGRPSDNPLIVHVASLEDAMQFTSEIPPIGIKLIEKFWPGPLTIVTKRKPDVPNIVTAGLDTVALRVPNHPIALELLRQFHGGIVGPSANISGKPSPTTAEHVQDDLNGMIDFILDAGPTTIGIESTVVDVTTNPPKILRLGGLTREKISEAIGNIGTAKSKELQKRSPGTRHRHYAPNATVVLFLKENANQYRQLIKKFRKDQKVIASITHSRALEKLEPSPLHITLKPSLEFIAKYLFGLLRELDLQGVDVIIVESVDEKGLGAAVMDRLRKSSAT
jgi:L-threonylcarbamoyladenylate synthase